MDDKTRQGILIRAASISKDVGSCSIGPNSSYQYDKEETSQENILKELVENSKSKSTSPATPRERVKSRSSGGLTPENLQIIKDNYQENVYKRKIVINVRKQMESRSKSEHEHYDKIQQMVERLRLDSEQAHLEKERALQQRIKEALRIEEEEENEYQKHCSEMAEHTRRILKQQEKELSDMLKKFQDRFTKLESNFLKIIQICPAEMTAIVEDSKKKLNALKLQKKSSKSPSELNAICSALEEYSKSLLKARDEYEVQLKNNREAEEKAKADEKAKEEEKLRANERLQQEQRAQREAATAAAAAVAVVQRAESENPLSKYRDLLLTLHNNTRNLTEQADLQNLRFVLKLTVNGPINKLSRVSSEESLVTAYRTLNKLLSGHDVETTKGNVSVNCHPEALMWIKMRLAEKLISNSDTRRDDVFLLSSLIVALCQDFPDFGQIFLAVLFKECPYLLPYAPRKLPGQSTDDFLKSLGYRIIESTNKQELYESWQARTTNFAGLMSAVWVTHCRKDGNQNHPFPIDNAWKYLVNVINSQPNALYIHLIDKVLEFSGSTLHMTYGKQFIKLIKVLNTAYLPALSQTIDEKMKAAYDRLKLAIATFERESKFPEPRGRLPLNYW